MQKKDPQDIMNEIISQKDFKPVLQIILLGKNLP